MTGIYQITNPTNKIYIGQSRDIKNRLSKYRTLRCDKQPAIFRSLLKYGAKNHDFKIVHELPKDVTQDILNKYEIFIWQQFIEAGFEMLNLKEPGSNGRSTEESRLKISKIHKGKPKSENFKRFMSENNPMKKPEIAKLMSEKLKGIARTESQKRHQSAVMTGKRTGYKAANGRAVIKMTLTGEQIGEYETMTEASIEVGTSMANIWSSIKGKTKTAAGFKWKYSS